ncbi:MAG: hypothetical protein DME58_03280 [Verrucomicrobia bacterium]|nr:MAG: hypothetical protein DME58_03280 [Verrucomicrobiota bacterium]
MLWFQAGASDFSRPGREWRPAGLPIVNRMSRCWFLATLVLSVVLAFSALAPCAWAQSKGRKGKPRTKTVPTSSPDEQSLTNIPLPIGHEAKGLVLPDFDVEGHLRGKFEAGTAYRIDQEHIGFQQLKITTYTPEDQQDLRIDMSTSVLDLKTRILSSKARTTIQRADFNIAGDSVEFDTNSKTGRLIGNIKMVITDKSHLTATPSPKE